MGNSCGDLESPPSRSNITFWAIIEIVAMGVVGVLCCMNLIDFFNYHSGRNLSAWDVIFIVVNAVVVVGLVFIILGLCMPKASAVKTGITCFLIGCICFLVLIIYGLTQGDKFNFWSLCEIIVMVFLAYILWKQSSHL